MPLLWRRRRWDSFGFHDRPVPFLIGKKSEVQLRAEQRRREGAADPFTFNSIVTSGSFCDESCAG